MANASHYDSGLDTPKTPIKSVPQADPAAPGKKFNSTPFVRKLSGNPSANKSLKHIHMDAALKGELAESELLDVPGLVEHLFPDSVFPVPFSTLYNAVYSKQWYTELDDWKTFFVRTYSGTSRGRIVPGEAETDLANFLNKLNKTIRDTAHTALPTATVPPQKAWVCTSEKPVQGGPNADRKPDVCLIPGTADGEDASATWHSILVPFEYKSNANDHRKALLQLINSAYMIFSTQDERRFIIGISLCGADVRVYVFDRAGVVGSTKFDFSYNPTHLVRLFAGLLFCGIGGIGLDPTIRHDEQGSRYITILNLEYQIIKTLFITDSIRGRGTVCWHAERDGKDYVIKDTWTDTSRIQTEAEILRAAEGIDGVSQLVAEEVVQICDKDDTTADIRSIIANLEKYKWKKWYEKVDVRLHRRLVTTPLAESLTNFRTRRELLKVIIGAIEAHGRLVERHILHRDISINNILIQRVASPKAAPACNESCATLEKSLIAPEAQTEEVVEDQKGILIDLDYAIITQDDNGKRFERSSDATSHRTGTLPFMAIEILVGLEPGQEHQPHHDLESFFFILLWISLHYAGPHNVERQDIDVDKMYPIQGWLEGTSIRELGFKKESSMMTPNKSFNRSVGNLVTKYFKDLIPCINELRARIFTREEEAEDVSPITHQEMIDILQKHHDLLPEVETWSQKDDQEGYTGGKRKLASIQEEDDEVVEQPNNSGSHASRKRARTSITQRLEKIPQSPTSRAVVRKTARTQRNSMPPPGH